MTRIADIEAHIGNMTELREIVGAMRSLAGMRVRRTQQMLPGIRGYADAMEKGIGTALLLVPETTTLRTTERGNRAVVLFTAEHGFVGGFNERLLDTAATALVQGDRLFVLGTRGFVAAEERGLATTWTHPMATRPEAAAETTRRLTNELYRGIASGEITRVEVTFARHSQAREMTIERRRVFPVDLSAFAAERERQPPLHNIPAGRLLERLITDYVFALLTEAAVESLTSENAARFAAMQSAHDNISDKLEVLHKEARQARQAEVTAELLDLATGAEAQSPSHAGELR
ncbi:MAG TPA: F0F1 ATP synthase subunit gamma [Stellaceae bacterium]|nr:F0F1 ATP synthase subunit gamma [Stellaceae bacterium]